MDELTRVFEYNGNEVRTIVNGEEVWFVAKDVCDILEIKNSRDAVSRLDDDEKGVVLTDTLGGKQELTIVNEAGLYTLILRSRKPEAKQFKRWITHEVLPTIRKTGGYVANDDLFIQTYLPFADEQTKLLFKGTLETVRRQNLLIQQKDKQLKEANEKLEEQQPFVSFAERIMKADKAIEVADLALLASKEGYVIGRNNLFKKLRSWGLLKDNNMPYQQYKNLDYFDVITVERNGMPFLKTLVRPKGQVYIINRLLKEQQQENETA